MTRGCSALPFPSLKSPGNLNDQGTCDLPSISLMEDSTRVLFVKYSTCIPEVQVVVE